jgi:membrane protein YdbS with pleckstrin-like domain
MIALLVKLLRPLYLPVLRLQLTAPHLPEGSTLVRELKPEPGWLTLKYLGVLAGVFGPAIGAVTASAVAIAALHEKGAFLAALLLALLFLLTGFGLVATRLDYELRHYLVGDKSLRVSHGAIVRREVTLSYANVQNVEVTQGPLEGLFKIKTLTISTAGGSSQPGAVNLHEAKLEGLKDAEGVKQLILGMLKGQKDAGLGEPHDAAHSAGLDTVALEEVRAAAVNLRNVAESLAVSVDFRQPAKN